MSFLSSWRPGVKCRVQCCRTWRTEVPLRIAGYGRCDSPGYSAKYCTYTTIGLITNAIVAFDVVPVTDTDSSSKMEVEGFRSCLEYLFQMGFQVELFASDRHVQIWSILKKEWGEIDHQFDVWHLVNSVKKTLVQKAKLKSSEELMPWVKSVTNHLWWCAANCGGDPHRLVEMWCSVVHHIVGQHTFPGTVFTSCAHAPYSEEEEKKKKWLQSGSVAHNALKTVMLDKRLLSDIHNLSQFCHNGTL